jgi:EmrB/QacA subfamily drug resistance transporter
MHEVGPTRDVAAAAPAAPGISLHSPQGRWVLLVTVLGSGMAFLDGTIVNVALPTIGRDLGASTNQLQWVLSGYLLTLASLILLGGSLGDRYGRRRVFVLGTVLFSAASLLCALAPNAGLLIGARLVQGVGGALLTPGSLAMIESCIRREDRPRAIGAWSGMTGVATALGPLLGGYLIGAVSWRAAFVINVPLGVVVLAAASHVPESRDLRARGRLDVSGAVLAGVALAGSTYALIQGPAGGGAAAIATAATLAVASFAAFVRRERRSVSPMLPLDIFSRQFTLANVLTFVVYAALGGVFFLLVAFLQISLGYSPVAAGAASLPVTVIMLCLSASSGTLAQRIGPRLPLAAGSAIVAIGMLLMTRIDPGASYPRDVLPAVVVFGLGLTLVVSPITATVLAAAGERRAGVASGVNNAVARVAGLLAVALLPLIAGLTGERFYEPAAMTEGFHIAMLACSGLAAGGGLLAWLTIDNDVLAAGQAPGAALAEGAGEFSCAVAGPPPR